MRAVIASCVVFGLLACKADIPDGKYVCVMDGDCPHGFVCRPRSTDSKLFCYLEDTAPDGGVSGGSADSGPAHDDAAVDGGQGHDAPGGDGGATSGTGTGFEVHGASFWSGGEPRNAGRYVVHDDGFDRGQTLCTAGHELCVTGGFSP